MSGVLYFVVYVLGCGVYVRCDAWCDGYDAYGVMRVA